MNARTKNLLSKTKRRSVSASSKSGGITPRRLSTEAAVPTSSAPGGIAPPSGNSAFASSLIILFLSVSLWVLVSLWPAFASSVAQVEPEPDRSRRSPQRWTSEVGAPASAQGEPGVQHPVRPAVPVRERPGEVDHVEVEERAVDPEDADDDRAEDHQSTSLDAPLREYPVAEGRHQVVDLPDDEPDQEQGGRVEEEAQGDYSSRYARAL